MVTRVSDTGVLRGLFYAAVDARTRDAGEALPFPEAGQTSRPGEETEPSPAGSTS